MGDISALAGVPLYSMLEPWEPDAANTTPTVSDKHNTHSSFTSIKQHSSLSLSVPGHISTVLIIIFIYKYLYPENFLLRGTYIQHL